MLLADSARWWLVAHAIVGGALVGAATHMAVWTRSYWRRDTARHRGVRRFAVLTAALFALNFAIGLAIYPVYKVRVRVAYLDDPGAALPLYETTSRVARWFDVKEHAIAIGFAVAVALAAIVLAWRPSRDGRDIAPAVAGLAWLVCAATWFAAIVGLVTTSYRAIGS
ncbi:MAG: hypothetical protein D6689_15890 [Deltaproteobacteria bacterium]|nr:MAG: hypothetical protein D6689_15890 [Deltaproteobacteria bacterium]